MRLLRKKRQQGPQRLQRDKRLRGHCRPRPRCCLCCLCCLCCHCCLCSLCQILEFLFVATARHSLQAASALALIATLTSIRITNSTPSLLQVHQRPNTAHQTLYRYTFIYPFFSIPTEISDRADLTLLHRAVKPTHALYTKKSRTLLDSA